MAAAPVPGPDDLRALADKYRALAELRERRDGGGPPPPTAELRALAARHPGCLRELDTLGAVELRRRSEAALLASRAGGLEPWMPWICGYHRLMLATLLVKRAVGNRPLGADQARLAEEATRAAGWPLDEEFVAEVARPPQGRLGVLVLRRLGALFATPPAEIARTLFPPRRPWPYTLG
jgi:hypothetical protein